jgi:cytochrome oxidase assembly protein ShyY1
MTIAACLAAGNWQRGRMEDKEALQAQFRAAESAASVALPSNVGDWRAWRFHRVTLTGEFDVRRQVLIDNKVHAGRAGFDLVAPFKLDDGRMVLVDCGWVAGGPTRAALPEPKLPRGAVTVHGRIDIPSSGYLQIGERPIPAGRVWQHLDPALFAQATGLTVLPIVVDALDIPGADELVHQLSLPDAGIEKHIGYMVQWYAFAAMAAGLWLWFTVRPRLLRSKRR